MDTAADKQYAEACVQTSPVVCATVIQDVGGDPPDAILTEDFQALVPSPVLVSLLQPTSTFKCITTGMSDSARPRTPLRAIKNSLPFARPSQFPPSLVVEDTLQRRIVSLPENLGVDVLKDDVARSILAASRSVSMPAAYRHFAALGSASEERNIARNTPSLTTDYEGDSHIQLSLRSPGLPETPSPPSSPDSIEIIENSAHLPDSFLHSKRKQGREANEYDEAAEWLTWSSSPPKPIPALHGPASLPYARCPSGAEGTVLEERSTVPGLIWGLTDDASNSENSRSQFPSIFNDINSHTVVSSHDDKQPAQKETVKSLVPTSQTTDGILEAMSCLRMQDDNSRRLPFTRQDTVRLPEHAGQTRPMDLLAGIQKQAVMNWNDAAESIPAAVNKNGTASTITTECDSHLLSKATTSIQEANSQDRIAEHTRSNSLLDFLRDQHPSALNATAPAFVPTRVNHSPRNVLHQDYSVLSIGPRGGIQSRQQSPRSGGIFFSPTESSSPVWSEPPTPLLETPPLHSLSMLSLPTPSLHTASPIFGRDSAFEQLKQQLALYQKNLETLSNLRQALHIGHAPVPQTNLPSLPYRPSTVISPPTFSRPCMPINLQDLVASQSPTFSPVVTPTTVSPSVFLPLLGASPNISTQNVDVFPPATKATAISTPVSSGEHRKPIHAGRRYPRSIPLNRMLERRLSSVPEETSTVTSDGPSSPVITHPMQETSLSSSADDIEGRDSPLSTKGEKAGSVLQKPVQGGKLTERIFRPKKTQTKTRGTNPITVTEQENIEPKDQSASQRGWKTKQVATANKGKSKMYKSRHKDE